MAGHTPFANINRKAHQRQALVGGTPQVQNNAGGYVYEIDKWKAFERFLILGTEGGTFYVKENELTRDNAKNAIACIDEDGKRAVDLIVAISDGNRAPKNDPAIFALALAASAREVATRVYALSKLQAVCRIPTHLFHFNAFVEQFRGRGVSLNRAIREWYQSKPVDDLAYSMIKFQQRDSWSHRDLLRLVKPKPRTANESALYRYFAKGIDSFPPEHSWSDVPQIIQTFEAVKRLKVDDKDSVKLLVSEIITHNLSREMIPTEFLRLPEVWEALLERMPPHALLRNLGNMSKTGLLRPLSGAASTVIQKLQQHEAMRRRRVHPMDVLVALKVYQQGKSIKGDGTWTPVPSVVDALNDLFYGAFGFVEPTGQRMLFGVDVSGSMRSPLAGTVISSAEGAAVMAMVCAYHEKEFYIHGFTAARGSRYWDTRRDSNAGLAGFIDLGITPKMRLDEAMARTHKSNFGSTDCAIPMLWATKNRINVDMFVVITDNETWAGEVHPKIALKAYREASGIPAKQVVIATEATNFSIADPADPLTLDVVGFDTNTPAAISEFART